MHQVLLVALYLIFLKKKKIHTIGTYNSNKKKGLVKFNLSKDNLKTKFKEINSKDIFVLLAAKTNNYWVLNNYKKTLKVNVENTINLIEQIKKYKAKIIYLSSAEIFDGKKGNYKETETGNPVSRYGKTKNLIEKYLISGHYNNYLIIRTGGNISLNPKFKCMVSQTYNSLNEKKPKMAIDNLFTITHENDFNKGLLKLIYKKKLKRKIFHISSDHVVSRVQFANLIIKNSKKLKNVKFQVVKFKDILYNEPRAAKNNLNSKYTKNILKMNYKTPEKIIKEKLKFIEK